MAHLHINTSLLYEFIEFEELDSGEEAQSIAMHKIGEADYFESTKGTYSLFFRPRIDIRRSLFKLSEKENKMTN